ncbi:hypothetical protein DMUE_3832, partial [Dictyocoela muelleri]
MIPNFEKILYTSEEITEELFTFSLLSEHDNKKFLLIGNSNENNDFQFIKNNFLSHFTYFKLFFEFYNSFEFLSVDAILDIWRSVFCSCNKFAKIKKCKHVYSYLC